MPGSAARSAAVELQILSTTARTSSIVITVVSDDTEVCSTVRMDKARLAIAPAVPELAISSRGFFARSRLNGITDLSRT